MGDNWADVKSLYRELKWYEAFPGVGLTIQGVIALLLIRIARDLEKLIALKWGK